MKSGNKKRYEAAFKAQVALIALQERETLAQIGQRFRVHPVLVSQWKRALLDKAASAFKPATGPDHTKEKDELLRKIGELEVERDFLARGLRRSK